MRCRSLAALPCALLVTVGCQGTAKDLPSPASPLGVRDASRSTVAGHLYVGDYQTEAVTVYSLNSGLPISAPDRTLNVGFNVLSLAVGVDGTTFVGGEGSGGDEVAVYAPNAQGSDPPERVLNLASGPWALAVDPAGYVYAGLAFVAVNVYAPGAAGSDPPVATILDSSFVGGLALDAGGNLYVADVDNGLTEYATPTTDPTPVRSTCFVISKTLNGVAISSRGTAYVAVDSARHLPHHSFVSPVGAHENGCPFKRRRLYTRPVFHNPIGVAEQAGRLYVSDTEYGRSRAAAIVILDEADRGHHVAPLHVLTGPQLMHPRGVALGP